LRNLQKLFDGRAFYAGLATCMHVCQRWQTLRGCIPEATNIHDNHDVSHKFIILVALVVCRWSTTLLFWICQHMSSRQYLLSAPAIHVYMYDVTQCTDIQFTCCASGFGNRPTDVVSYRAVNVPDSRILIINPQGTLPNTIERGHCIFLCAAVVFMYATYVYLQILERPRWSCSSWCILWVTCVLSLQLHGIQS
jgi:hypothetical protein